MNKKNLQVVKLQVQNVSNKENMFCVVQCFHYILYSSLL